jgi:hypothetical protein
MQPSAKNLQPSITFRSFGVLDAYRAALAEGRGTMECTPKVRHRVKAPATLNGGEVCWCPGLPKLS